MREQCGAMCRKKMYNWRPFYALAVSISAHAKLYHCGTLLLVALSGCALLFGSHHGMSVRSGYL